MRATFLAYHIQHLIAKSFFATDNEASHYANSWIFNYPFTGLDKPLKVQEFEASRISKQSAYKDGKVVSPTHQTPLSPRHTPGNHFC